MIFHEKRIRFTLFFPINGHICSKFEIFRENLEIADDHNFWTEYARDLKFVSMSKCVILDTLGYYIPLITQFRPKVDLVPFGNELFICRNF